MNHHIEELTLKDVTKRVAGFILTEQKKGKAQDAISLNISKNDLAAYLGTIPETLSRTLKKLQDEDMITVDGKVIKICDMDRLKDSAS